MSLDTLYASNSQEVNLAALQILAESIPLGIIVVEKTNGKIVYVNKCFFEITGFNPIGFSFREYALNMAKVHNLDNGSPCLYEQLPLIQALLNGKTTRNHEIRIQRADGLKLTVLVNTKLLVTVKQEIIGAVGVFEDVTKRKESEEALRASEYYYRTLFENSEEGYALFEAIYDKDEKLLDLRYIAVNSAFQKQIGNDSIQPIGKTMRQIFPSLDSDWFKNIGKILSSRKPTHIAKCNKDTGRFYDSLCVPFSKDLLGCIFTDITEYKKLEEELRNRERLADIGATAGMVGHDIRNPLQAIIGDIYLLKDYFAAIPEMPTKHDVAESLEEIEKNVGYINKIVADLQDYSKAIKPELKELNLYDLVISAFRAIEIPENVNPSLEIDPRINFKTDPTLFTRILTNLIINAIQAMPKGGQLIVGASLNNEIKVMVTDTGEGIPEHVKPKLFTPMMTTKAKGQGLGLAVVKKAVEAMGGSIKFESQEGKGTKFIINLPIL